MSKTPRTDELEVHSSDCMGYVVSSHLARQLELKLIEAQKLLLEAETVLVKPVNVYPESIQERIRLYNIMVRNKL